jgi:hypothetical protein
LITTPYMHPKKFKDEIENSIKELLDMGHSRPSSSPFATFVVLLKNKGGTMWMCIEYRALNRKMIKNKYPIPRINELLDEFHRAVYFLRLILDRGTTISYFGSRIFPKLLSNAIMGIMSFWSCHMG